MTSEERKERNRLKAELLKTHVKSGDAADIIGCSKETIKNWVESGRLSCTRIPVNDRGDLMRFIPKKEVEAQRISYQEWKNSLPEEESE